ncbi:MAG: fibrobacter succinogenes major paralogous domain-containing protein [Bacteroidales bacterium]|nr:fibrobacter succinogenes major paralogous domain-containing protein [Bacteroidales bacterium]
MKKSLCFTILMSIAVVLLMTSCHRDRVETIVTNDAVTDIDGNSYDAVQIGNQVWMAENLRTTHYANGDSIPMGGAPSNTEPGRFYPNYSADNVNTHGYLYNWAAVMNGAAPSSANPSAVQGICPDGWHVPSDAEWTQLTDYVSSHSQFVSGDDNTHIAKALASAVGWNSSTSEGTVGNNVETNNSTNFSVLPAGHYTEIPPGHYGCTDFGEDACFWTATEYENSDMAYSRGLYYDYSAVKRFYREKFAGYSVRCVRD